MNHNTRTITAALAAAILALGLAATASADSKPKYTIKQIMKDGLKGGLAKKVIEEMPARKKRSSSSTTPSRSMRPSRRKAIRPAGRSSPATWSPPRPR